MLKPSGKKTKIKVCRFQMRFQRKRAGLTQTEAGKRIGISGSGGSKLGEWIFASFVRQVSDNM